MENTRNTITQLLRKRRISSQVRLVIMQAGVGSIDDIMASIGENDKALILAKTITELAGIYSNDVDNFYRSLSRTVESDSKNGYLTTRLTIIEKLNTIIDFATHNLKGEKLPIRWDIALFEVTMAASDPVEAIGLAALAAESKLFPLLNPSRDIEEEHAVMHFETELNRNILNADEIQKGRKDPALLAKLSKAAKESLASYLPSRPAALSPTPKSDHPTTLK